MSENTQNLPGENIYETILQENPLKIFERKSAKEYSKEIQRKKIQKKSEKEYSKKIRERIFERKSRKNFRKKIHE